MSFSRFIPRIVARPPRALAWRIFVTCWLVFVLHFATNIVRELYPVLSLGDNFSFDVSEYMGLHPDIFVFEGRGTFINNNPGASLLGAVPYVVFRPIIDPVVDRVQANREANPQPAPEYASGYELSEAFARKAYERGLDIKFALAAAVTQVFLMAPLAALSAVVMFYVLLALKQSPGSAVALALLYAFATPIFYRAAQLNHNLLQALFAFFAFVLLWQPWENEENYRPKRIILFLSGLLCGWTLVLDYSGLIIIAAITAYAFVRLRGIRTHWFIGFVIFASGVALAAAVLPLTQWLNFGNPIYPAQHYMPDTRFSGSGYQGIALPQLDLLLELTFGIRFGLFTAAPFLLLALYPPAWFNKRVRLLQNRETWFILLFTVAFFLFTAANQFARLQFNTGIRHIVPVVPFLFLIAAGSFQRLPRWLALVVAVAATYWSWSLAMYRDVERGLGIFEAVWRTSAEGWRLPWLTTLERMGYLPDGPWALVFIVLAAGLIGAMWLIRPKSSTRPD